MSYTDLKEIIGSAENADEALSFVVASLCGVVTNPMVRPDDRMVLDVILEGVREFRSKQYEKRMAEMAPDPTPPFCWKCPACDVEHFVCMPEAVIGGELYCPNPKNRDAVVFLTDQVEIRKIKPLSCEYKELINKAFGPFSSRK